MAKITQQRGAKVFPFFDLPRELRDMIYDLLTLPLTIEGWAAKTFRFDATVPFRTTHLVNKRFSRECAEQVTPLLQVTLGDLGRPSSVCGSVPLVPRSACFATTLTLECIHYCWHITTGSCEHRAAKTVVEHRHWLPEFADGFVRLKSIHINFHIRAGSGETACRKRLTSYLHLLAKFEQLKSVSIYLFEDDGRSACWEDRTALLKSWSRDKEGRLSFGDSEQIRDLTSAMEKLL